MRIYISSSWKLRDRVRAMATALRENGHDVYDFTDPTCRKVPEIPPEQHPVQFDPAVHNYWDYLRGTEEWKAAVDGNFEAIDDVAAFGGVIILLLPSGLDAHMDAYYGLGLGVRLAIVGHPHKGERSPTHLKAHAHFDHDEQAIAWAGTA